MSTFEKDTVEAANVAVSKAVLGKINSFYSSLQEIPEIKEKNISKERLVDIWNASSPIKISASLVTNDKTSEEKKERVRTNKNQKCQVPKTRGDNVGQPCGKNCVIGSDYCTTHAKKFEGGNGVSTSENESVVSSVGTCQHVLISGVNAGKLCSKKATKDSKWCTAHAKKHASE